MKLSPKYRVYKEPPWDGDVEPSVQAGYLAGVEIGPDGVGEKWLPLEPVEGFVFVLKPETDSHARTVLVMYSLLIEEHEPKLAEELIQIVSDMQ